MKFQLTEKNAANVMQVINTFFKKSVFEFFKDVERWNYEMDGDDLKKTITIQDEYKPMIDVRCEKHPLYKKDSFSPFPKPPVLLFVSSKYEDSGISLYAGDVVVNHGNRLIIKTQNHHLRCKEGRSYWHKDWSEQHFIQGEVSESIRENMISAYFERFVLDFMINEFATINIPKLDDEYEMGFDSISDFFTRIDNSTQYFMNVKPFVEESLIFENAKHSITWIRNFAAFKKVGIDCGEKEVIYYRIFDKDKNLLLETNTLYDFIIRFATSVEHCF